MLKTKYNFDLESFFDIRLFYPVSQMLMPVFRKLSLTPNILTTFSLVAVILALFYIFRDTNIASVYMLIAYIFDCADGMYARKYNMMSVNGMVFDYVKDGIFNTSFYMALVYRYVMFFKIDLLLVIVITMLLIYLCLIWFGINEVLIHNSSHPKKDYFEYKKSLFKKQTVLSSIYLNMCYFFYVIARPFITKDIQKMTAYARMLKLFGHGNMVIFVFIIMNIWKIP